MSGFYLRNQNDIPEILFMKNDNWNVKMIRNNSEIRLEYILAFMGNYLFWNDSNNNGVDMCNFVNEFFSLFLIISTVFLFFSIVILVIFTLNNFRNRNNYEIIN
jgi:hypothetical protein